jgi:hypothetical protein
MKYENMTKEDQLAMLREAEQAAEELRIGDVKEEIDTFRKAAPNAWRDDEYDYATAARDGALPIPGNEQNANMSPDYMRKGMLTDATFNVADGTYDYDAPDENSYLDSFFQTADLLFSDDPGYWLTRTGFRAAQVAAQGLVDQFWNEPRLLANKRESDLILMNIDALDRNKAMLDPEYFDTEMARLQAKVDPEATEAAWDTRPQVNVIRPIDYKDEVVSEIGAFLVPYLGATKALKPLQAALKADPAKMGKYLNATVTSIKELVAGMFADRNLAFGADYQENFATVMQQAIEIHQQGDEGTFANIGEFLEDIGIQSEDLAAYDPKEADGDLERANLFALEGAILGVLLPAVLKGVFGPVKLGRKFWTASKKRRSLETAQ